MTDPATLEAGAKVVGAFSGLGRSGAAAPTRSDSGGSYSAGGLTINKTDWTTPALVVGGVLIAAMYFKGQKSQGKPKPKKKGGKRGR